MARDTQLGPSCQSCAAPLMRADDFGREASGVLRTDYCIYCYNKGAFTQPDITFDQMVEKVAVMMAKKRNMTDEAARAQTKAMLSGLKRWRVKKIEPMDS
ncbi:MAG: zinc ribbon domain-containing protein [Deltaproteobacteria bacterium]|nr:zinc ribbon domain-containing protein [Deltaproteobacteria bacterium]